MSEMLQRLCISEHAQESEHTLSLAQDS